MIFSNDSTPVGEVKKFFRYGKHRFYLKTESGVVEITARQYAERTDSNEAKNIRRAASEISEIIYAQQNATRTDIGNSFVDRYAGKTAELSGQNVGEELRSDARRNISNVRGSSNRGDVSRSLAPVFQKISSAKTSIKQVPALFKNPNAKFGAVNVDIGGGKFDLAADFLAQNGTRNLVFDPYNRLSS